ncbi:hypothetical protein [uncultured Chloroflexus sp.]|uniref:hypothetical protein n=1 Tax=uncultured Chloroflexus sp. TaxID=214040 RepID=UPI0026189FBD|nr:hypothetical protein [uncultured Chloroflexus sp.]
MTGIHFGWQLNGLFWKLVFRNARWSVVDRLLPKVLGWLDRSCLLATFGRRVPNSTWLVARKVHV